MCLFFLLKFDIFPLFKFIHRFMIDKISLVLFKIYTNSKFISGEEIKSFITDMDIHQV